MVYWSAPFYSHRWYPPSLGVNLLVISAEGQKEKSRLCKQPSSSYNWKQKWQRMKHIQRKGIYCLTLQQPTSLAAYNGPLWPYNYP